MRIALIISVILVSWNFLTISSAQNDGFQSVSGDFARSWLNDLQAEKAKPTEEKDGSLWAWGGAPRGRIIVDGTLFPLPNETIAKIADLGSSTGNWLGEVYIDPYLGSPVYYNRPPTYGSNSMLPINPGYNPDYYPSLPPVFKTNDPWA
jgi:hypothetical protein